ncbi:hypothetical protein XOC_1552 [Xanthomonas oryzae pv. oryzicola BLS256]|uniref:Uncharacterized protein n=1 Tax=Xanthomonas oryzae pv. oryzicola (strain BLS256) TaxID=383407 RepID=G7TJY9_XANOB|nr:hypothetical protein XOC_1552 [Xanthomonas oryzae pv. oryzicola BLS256]QEO98362.1 hypothetical protein XOCgx_3373 [Xanthomonas oryzae pv. oryzicola]
MRIGSSDIASVRGIPCATWHFHCETWYLRLSVTRIAHRFKGN